MGKITGMESMEDVPSKVLQMYEAVEKLIGEGVDINDIRVSTITDTAGIGKGTAYDYFDTKEDILACAIIFYMRKATEALNVALSKYLSFAQQLTFLLEEIEKGSEKQQCFIRYIHMMTDTSNLSRLVREKLEQKEIQRYLPEAVFATILEKGKERGELRKSIPIDYMVYVLFSKIILYMISIGRDNLIALESTKIRQFVYQGILDELCEKSI